MEAAKTVVPYVNITAKLDSVADQGLLTKKGGGGFPFVTIMTSDGDVLWEFWPQDKSAFDAAYGQAKRLIELKAKSVASPTDKVVAANHMLLDSSGRQQRPQVASIADLQTAAATPGADAKLVEAFKEKIPSLAMNAARSDGGKAVYELLRGGYTPSGRSTIGMYYYGAKGAIVAKDAANASKFVALFEAAASKNPQFAERAKKDADKMREEIKALSAAK